MTNLIDDWVEEAVWEHFLHLLFNPPVGSEVRDVCLVSRASTASEQPDEATVSVEHYGTGVAGSRKGPVTVAVGVDGDIDRCLLDAVLKVPANERLHAGEATDSGACGPSVLDDKQTRLAVGIELLRLADLVILHYASDLKEPGGRVLEVGPALRVRVHLQNKVGL